MRSINRWIDPVAELDDKVMKRTLSAPYRRMLFMPRWPAGVIGGGVAVYILFRLHALTGFTWPIVTLGAAIVLGVSTLIVLDDRMRRSLKVVAVDDRFLYVTKYAESTEARFL